MNRFMKMGDGRCGIIGREDQNILEPWHVYSVRKILDEIILTDLGETCLDYTTWDTDYGKQGDTKHLLSTGTHLITLEEYKLIVKKDKLKKVENWEIEVMKLDTEFDYIGESTILKDKIVKCRKEHNCDTCCKTISINEKARSITSVNDVELTTDYICKDCCIETINNI